MVNSGSVEVVRRFILVMRRNTKVSPAEHLLGRDACMLLGKNRLSTAPSVAKEIKRKAKTLGLRPSNPRREVGLGWVEQTRIV